MRRGEQAEKNGTAFLNRPGILLPKPTFLAAFFFYAVLLFVAWLSAFGCFYTAFQIQLDWPPLVFAAVSFGLLCGAQFLMERHRWVFPLITAGLGGFALWRNFEEAAQGFRLTVNAVSEAYSLKLRLEPPLPTLSTVPSTSLGQLASRNTFAVFLSFLFLWLLSWLLVRHKSVLGAFCLTGLFLLLPLSFSIVPEEWAFGLLLVFWAFLLLAAPSMRQRRQLIETGDSFHSSGDMFFRPASLALLPVLALCLIVLYRLFPPETYSRPQFITDLRSGLTESLGISSSFHSGTQNTDRVDFSALGSRRYTVKTALQVQYEWQNGASKAEISLSSPTGQKDYLKSFVGSVYTGTSWEHLSREDTELVNEIWEAQPAQTLSSSLLLAMPMESDPRFSYLLSVRKLEGNTQAVYAPYGLYAPDGPPKDTKYQDDGFLQSSHILGGVKEHRFSAVALPSWKYAAGYAERFTQNFSTATNRLLDEERASELQAALAEDFEEKNRSGLPYPNWDRWKAPEWAKRLLETYSGSALSPLINSNPPFTGAELVEPLESYTEFVYQTYTRLPDSAREFAEAFLTENRLPSLNAIGRQAYIQRLQALLAERCTYTLTPPALPQGQDFVEYFLTESHSGYCVHFATAAVVLLRTAGIPARYAEGYCVPSGTDGRWVNVPDYNAHAWVEVYWGDMGWLPVEMTPPGPMVPAAYANAIGPGEDEMISPSPTPDGTLSSAVSSQPESSAIPEMSPSPAPSASPAPAGSQEETASSTGPNASSSPGIALASSGRLTLWVLLFIDFCMALPFLLLWVFRLFRLFQRKNQFSQRNRNKAALCVYAHLLRLYRANTALPGDGIDPPEELTQLALKARFSDHTLTRQELSQLTDQAELLEKKLAADLPKWERLRCKYLLALF